MQQQEVFTAAEELSAELGRTPTQKEVRARIGRGSMRDIGRLFRAWQAQRERTEGSSAPEEARQAARVSAEALVNRLWPLAAEDAERRLAAERDQLAAERDAMDVERAEAAGEAERLRSERDAARADLERAQAHLETTEARLAEEAGARRAAKVEWKSRCDGLLESLGEAQRHLGAERGKVTELEGRLRELQDLLRRAGEERTASPPAAR